MPDHDDHDDILIRLRGSHHMLKDSPLWANQGSRAFKVWSVAAMLLAGTENGTVAIHPQTLADSTGFRIDKVRETLKLLDSQGVLSWEQGYRSSDLGRLALPTMGEVVDWWLA